MTEELHLHLRADGVTVVHAPRMLTAATAPAMRKAFIALTNVETVPQIVVDLGATELADSMGLGSLLGGHRRAKVSGGHFVLADADERLRDQIERCGLLKIVRLFDSATEAIDALKAATE